MSGFPAESALQLTRPLCKHCGSVWYIVTGHLNVLWCTNGWPRWPSDEMGIATRCPGHTLAVARCCVTRDYVRAEGLPPVSPGGLSATSVQPGRTFSYSQCDTAVMVQSLLTGSNQQLCILNPHILTQQHYVSQMQVESWIFLPVTQLNWKAKIAEAAVVQQDFRHNMARLDNLKGDLLWWNMVFISFVMTYLEAVVR